MTRIYTTSALRKAIREAEEVYIYAHVCEDVFPVLVPKAAGLRLCAELEEGKVNMPRPEAYETALAWTDNGQVYIG